MANDQDSGANMHGWFASYDHESSSWKTSQTSLFEDSTECSVTLPRSGMMRNGKLYQRGTPERPTCGGGFSLSLPTPTANLARKARVELRDEGPYQSLEKSLARLQPESIGGRLSPHFVRWLMGFPDGWISSAAWETQSSRRSRKSSGSALGSSSHEDA